MQDDDTPMDEETIEELSYDAYLVAQDSEKLGKREQVLKWCQMLERAEESVEKLKEEIEGRRGKG